MLNVYCTVGLFSKRSLIYLQLNMLQFSCCFNYMLPFKACRYTSYLLYNRELFETGWERERDRESARERETQIERGWRLYLNNTLKEFNDQYHHFCFFTTVSQLIEKFRLTQKIPATLSQDIFIFYYFYSKGGCRGFFSLFVCSMGIKLMTLEL